MTKPPEPGLFGRLRGGRVAGILGVYAAFAFGALQVVDLLADNLGLPSWVFPTALVLLVVGLPIILATAFVQAPAAPAHPAPPRRWLTWRRALLGGATAFIALGLTASGYLALRAAGIGPFGSLVAKGEIDESDRILVADFHSVDGDSVLAGVLTEAFRIDLAQSNLVRTLDRSTLQEALARMERDPGGAIDADLARELAQREGIPAVLAGEIGSAGPSYLLGVRLIAAEDGRDLAAFRETAADSTELIPAVDRLSKKMRERLGESLRSIRRSEALAQVTTASLPALRKYTQAVRALDSENDADHGIPLLEEALRMDTAFAMAWRKLAVALANNAEARERHIDAATRAWNHLDRLTARERYMTEGTYYSAIGDTRAAMRAYESLLEEWPQDHQALNNLAMAYTKLGDDVTTEALMRRAIEADSNSALQYRNLAEAQVNLGRFDEAEATLEAGARRLSRTPFLDSFADLALARGDYARSDSLNLAALSERRTDLRFQASTHEVLSLTAAVRGQLARAESHAMELDRLNREIGRNGRVITTATTHAVVDAWVLGDTARAIRRLETVLAREPIDELPVLERPYLDVAWAFAFAGETPRARHYVDAYERLVDAGLRSDNYVHGIRSLIAIAEGIPDQALAEARQERESDCRECFEADVARAFLALGQADSAIAAYERFFAVTSAYRIFVDFVERGPALQRLAELYEARGDPAAAAQRYAELLELWNGADPALQPQVEEIRRRLARLTAERG